jgi:hypothetical protein
MLQGDNTFEHIVASQMVLLPLIIVVARAEFDVAFPSWGKRLS